MVVVSAYIGAGDVPEMSVVRGGVCDMCMCLAQGGVRDDWVWALPILEKQGEVGYVSVFWLRWCGWAYWARVWEGGVVLSLCLL